MRRKAKVAPGRKNLNRPKPKGVVLLAQLIFKLENKYENKILKTPVDCTALLEFKDKLWTCTQEATDVKPLDRIGFFAVRLNDMIEKIQQFTEEVL